MPPFFVPMKRLRKHWWEEPTGPTRKPVLVRHLRHKDPHEHDLPPIPTITIGAFKPSRLWVPYNRLEGIETGYAAKMYSIREIAIRYGLSVSASRYYKRNILPEPFDIVRRRSSTAHHWSRFTLMALDTVLEDLEKRGFLYFRKNFHDHVDLIQIGSDYITRYYQEKYEEEDLETHDKMGVDWMR